MEKMNGHDAIALAQQLLLDPSIAKSDSEAVPGLKNLFLSYTEELKSYILSKLQDGLGECLLELGLDESGASMQLLPNEFEMCMSNIKDAARNLGADARIGIPLHFSKYRYRI